MARPTTEARSTWTGHHDPRISMARRNRRQPARPALRDWRGGTRL